MAGAKKIKKMQRRESDDLALLLSSFDVRYANYFFGEMTTLEQQGVLGRIRRSCAPLEKNNKVRRWKRAMFNRFCKERGR